MPPKTSLVPDFTAERPERETLAPKKRQSNAGKFHLAAYFDIDDPILRGFRRLVADTHKSNQELIAEAIQLLLDHHAAKDGFRG